MSPQPSRGPVSRWFDSMVRSWTYEPGRGRPPEERQLSEQPGLDDRVERTKHRLAWVLALVGPLVLCAGLVLVREDVDRSTAALLLVLPVTLVAVLGGPGPAALAAVVAPLAFDVLLTRPYYRLQMHTSQDVEATLILLAVGLVVGQLVSRETRARARMTTRGHEIEALVTMMTATELVDTAELPDRATGALRQLLDLRECRWAPGYHGQAYPQLARDGEITGRSDSRDRAGLPSSGVEIPVVAGDRELGRIILVPSGAAPVSREERIVAVAIADALGMALARSETS